MIFELAEVDAGPSAGAGALDAITALRAEPSTATLPILLLVPEGRAELRDLGFKAGASDVCWIAREGSSGFEEALLHLAGIPLRRQPRRAAAIALRFSHDGSNWRNATALNLSPGGMQIRWEAGDVPPTGSVLKVELGGATLYASVLGGTKLDGARVTRLRFVGLSASERAQLESAVAALPGPDEPEPELTPVPDDGPPSLAPRRFAPNRYTWGIAIGATLLVAGVAARFVVRGPLEEPARISAGAP